MKHAVVFGSKSDIAKGIIPMLKADGWSIEHWYRGYRVPYRRKWDLFLCCTGRVAPVGYWWQNQTVEWNKCVYSNLLTPIGYLREVWPNHNNGASVIFMAGSNPQKIMPGYSAYNTSKMALLKFVEQADVETPDAKFVALGPGYVKTKIHRATLKKKWPNERIARGDDGNSMESIYRTLKWCILQDKATVGGRNICVSDNLYSGWLDQNPDLLKLRRVE